MSRRGTLPGQPFQAVVVPHWAFTRTWGRQRTLKVIHELAEEVRCQSHSLIHPLRHRRLLAFSARSRTVASFRELHVETAQSACTLYQPAPRGDPVRMQLPQAQRKTPRSHADSAHLRSQHGSTWFMQYLQPHTQHARTCPQFNTTHVFD